MEGCRLGILFGVGLLLAGSPANCDETLRGAIEAFQKRQRDLDPRTYLPRSLFLDDGQPEDIGYGYQKNIPPLGLYEQPDGPYDFDDRSDIRNQEKLILDYLDQESNEIPLDLRYPAKKSIFREREDAEPNDDTPLFINSPFRERLSYKDKGRQGILPLIRNMEKAIEDSYDDADDDNEYLNMLQSVWDKYRGERDEKETVKEDVEDLMKYLNLKEDKRQMEGAYGGYDFFNTPYIWAKRSFPDFAYGTKRSPYQAFEFDDRYPYSPIQKRFPITKRSPSYGVRVKKNSETDPKVAEELNNIFSTSKRSVDNKTAEGSKTNQTSSKSGQKEQTDSAQQSSKRLDIKKKSIDWSNYFGIDRRRKKSLRSRTPEDEWLVNHYLGSYFAPKDEENDLTRRGEEMDDRLKNLEDMVLDQAIKFTGAHEGENDPDVTEEVKNRVLSQLAAAYSIERMRQALNELKPSYLAQKASAPSKPDEPKEASSPEPKAEEKKEEVPEPLKEDDEETKKKKSFENVKVPGKPGSCRILRELEVRCNEACHIAGDRLGVFQRLCIYHEICNHCGFEGGPSISSRTCDVYFLENAKNACEDSPVCPYTARQMLLALRGLQPPPTCDARDHSCLASYLSQ